LVIFFLLMDLKSKDLNWIFYRLIEAPFKFSKFLYEV
jgi:hypothetical protein